MPKQQTEPLADPIRFTTNVIAPVADAPGGSRFIVAGEDSPYHSLDEVPINLRPVVVTGEAEEPEEENTARGSFQLGVAYEVTPDNRLGRARGRSIERQVAELEAENQREEWIEEVAASSELPPEIAADLEDQYRKDVDFTAAQMGADARRADDIAEAAIAAQEPPQLFVRRGSRHYIQIHRTKLKPAEPVFVKDADGSYESIGICDAKAQPPTPPIVL